MIEGRFGDKGEIYFEIDLIGGDNFSFPVETMWFFGSFYGKPGSKSLKALLCGHFIENMGIIVYNPCPVRVLL